MGPCLCRKNGTPPSKGVHPIFQSCITQFGDLKTGDTKVFAIVRRNQYVSYGKDEGAYRFRVTVTRKRKCKFPLTSHGFQRLSSGHYLLHVTAMVRIPISYSENTDTDNSLDFRSLNDVAVRESQAGHVHLPYGRYRSRSILMDNARRSSGATWSSP